jgi:tetratricopeptide (TPR) repeat protein
VSPQESIPEADAIYNKALAIHNKVKLIPLAGALPENKKRAKEALDMFKQVLKEYPTSDKVDDCAFYCGEIYKEYLREDDPDDELSVRYYQWAAALDPKTPHPARFQCAVVYDFRRHERARAIELYNQVLDLEENGNKSNQRFSPSRIEQLTDEQYSHLKPQLPARARSRASCREPESGEPHGTRKSGDSSVRPAAGKSRAGATKASGNRRPHEIVARRARSVPAFSPPMLESSARSAIENGQCPTCQMLQSNIEQPARAAVTADAMTERSSK